MAKTKHIAMWSGPRNISTAMMRSWGNRADTFVCDEPFYAHYLNETRLDHPGMNEVIASQPTDWREVVNQLTGPVPQERAYFYQKHMTHHMLPNIGRDWLDQVTNAFLIRDPRDMIISLAKVLSHVRLVDTGLPQQLEIFEQISRRTGRIPAVVDARDVQNQPAQVLPKLCDALEVDFDPAMLSWPAGSRKTDGVWAKYWYANVEKTTCFEPYQSKSEPVPESLGPIMQECIEIYKKISDYSIKA